LATEVTILSSSRKDVVLAGLSIVAAAGVLWLFIVCCWSAAADAQGAVAFVFAVPYFESGLVSVVLAWSARRWLGGRIALGAAVGLAVFIGLFYGAASVPRLRFFSDGVIRLVADAYKGMTGKSPFQADEGY
jgi:hypothetical protein